MIINYGIRRYGKVCAVELTVSSLEGDLPPLTESPIQTACSCKQGFRCMQMCAYRLDIMSGYYHTWIGIWLQKFQTSRV
jgi:hypothetical protein